MPPGYHRLEQEDQVDAPLLSHLDIDDSQSLGLDNRTAYSNGNRSTRRPHLKFFGVAALTGIVLQALVWGFAGAPSGNFSVLGAENCTARIPLVVSSMTKNGTREKAEADRWALSDLKEIVSRTKGYYARDYSLNLGWNNMRFIIETGLLHAHLLNRTLVIPSFVYARACEFEVHACAAYTTMVNRNDALNSDEWRNAPMDKQMGFKVPIGIMLDLTHIRKTHSVVTVEEYLLLHNLPTTIEWSTGHWHPVNYHKTEPPVSLYTISNSEYDPKPSVRVDRLPPGGNRGDETSQLSQLLFEHLGNQSAVMPMEAAKEVVSAHLNLTEVNVESVLEKNGWAVLHTFRGSHGKDWMKSVVDHMLEVAPRSRLRGLVDEYDRIDAEVLLLEGEIHLDRKPGSLFFTSMPPRDAFAQMVLFEIRPLEAFRSLALKIHARLEARVEGRMWMGAHMRRGDFINMGWTSEWSIEAHFTRLKRRLTTGRGILERLRQENGFQTYQVPGIKPEHEAFDREPPKANDPFYLATDARTPQNMEYMRKNGAILIDDLLTLEDRQAFGWPIMLTDVLSILEQTVLSHSAFFVGHEYSSVTGGVVNMRAAMGADPRTALIE
ncbi:O-FucT domain protein [Ceratobasidium sp. AG-Ba]|nr:O-FucT domain protein [Ceratobasidium sp. AG-Ba]